MNTTTVEQHIETINKELGDVQVNIATLVTDMTWVKTNSATKADIAPIVTNITWLTRFQWLIVGLLVTLLITGALQAGYVLLQ